MNLGIYIQVPFCKRKCTYCNFRTQILPRAGFSPYISAVNAEIRSFRQLYKTSRVHLSDLLSNATVGTVYIGGGTPSLLDTQDLQSLLDSTRQSFTCELEEVTLEADPETIEPEKPAGWLRAGIDRVSLGAQSFSDTELKAAGRMHRCADLYRAMPILRSAGVKNISIDLIAGLPHQTEETWRHSLREAVGMAPEHISIYMLEIDEGSRLGREVLSGGSRYSANLLPSEDEVADFYSVAQEKLAAAGYQHYEISNWALPGRESRHNLKYWRREPYLGFGAGAHSFSGTQRWANVHDPEAYVSSIERNWLPVGQCQEVGIKQAVDEELFLGLRQLKGIDIQLIEQIYGVSIVPRLERLVSAGLVEHEGSILRLAPKKLSIANEVFVELLR